MNQSPEEKLKRPVLTIALLVLSACIISAGVFAVIQHDHNMQLQYSKTQLAFGDEQQIDIEELQKYSSLETLDLREAKITAEKYEEISAALPQCSVLWTVPLSCAVYDGSYANTAKALELPSVTDEDLLLLHYFQNAKSIHIASAGSYDGIMDYSKIHPSIKVTWNVNIYGEDFLSESESISLPSENADGLEQYLKYLPRLINVELTGQQPDAAALLGLMDAYPKIGFLYNVSLYGAEYSSETTQLDLTHIAAPGLDELSQKIPLLLNLEYVDMRGCSVSGADMLETAGQHPGIQFDWSFELYGVGMTTADEYVDLSGIEIPDIGEISAVLPYMHELKKADMRNCGLGNDKMDVLFTSFPDIKFVWNVKVGKYWIPTDVQCFSMKNYSKYASNASEFVRIYDCEVLKYCTDLVALDLGHNYITDISPLAGLTKMRVLIIADNCITDLYPLAGMKDLEYLEFFLNDVQDISVLSNFKKLVDLNCCHNSITDASAVTLCPLLERAWMSYNEIPKEQQEELKSALPGCKFNFTIYSSTGDGWREVERFFWVRGLFNDYYLSE